MVHFEIQSSALLIKLVLLFYLVLVYNTGDLVKWYRRIGNNVGVSYAGYCRYKNKARRISNRIPAPCDVVPVSR